MTYTSTHLGIHVEYRQRLPGVVDLNIQPSFVQAMFTPSTVGDVRIDSEHIGDVFVNGKLMTNIEPHEHEDIAALEKLRTTLELDTAIPYTIYTFAELRVRRLQSENDKLRAALEALK